MYFKNTQKSKLNYLALTVGVFFIYWRNHCSIIQIKTYYNNSKVKLVLDINNRIYNDDLCRKNEKENRPIFHDVILNIIPYKKKRKIIERLLELQYCLSNFDFVEKITIPSSFSWSMESDKYNQLQISNIIANEFDRQPDITTKEKYLIFTLENLKNNNAISLSNDMYQEIKHKRKKEQSIFLRIIYSLLEHSDIIKSIKNGNYVMNVVETIKIELVSHINKLLFTIKDCQNKSEYFIKHIMMESSYLFGLIVNYVYFLLWAITFLGIWIMMTINIFFK